MGLFDFMKPKQKLEYLDIFAPIKGEIVDLEKVPDPVFSEKMVGDGLAIMPSPDSEFIFAPVSGTIEKIFDTNHAFTIVSEGVEVLVHFGLDTVQLEGKGFERLAKEGATVEQGEAVIKYDLEFLKQNAKDVVSPVLISNNESYKEMEKSTGKVDKDTKLLKLKL